MTKQTKLPHAPAKARAKAEAKTKAQAEAKSRKAASVSRAAKGTGTGRGAAGAKRGGEKAKRMGVLDAAARVLQGAAAPMRCADIVQEALAKGYWQTSGKTPAATLSSAILREIRHRGQAARFRKVERGQFALAR